MLPGVGSLFEGREFPVKTVSEITHTYICLVFLVWLARGANRVAPITIIYISISK